MYNLISPPTLIAVCREMVRETKEPAFSSAPGIDAVPCLSCLWLSCSSSSPPLPAHTHVLQNTFSSGFGGFFPPLVYCLFLQLHFSFVLRTCLGSMYGGSICISGVLFFVLWVVVTLFGMFCRT